MAIVRLFDSRGNHIANMNGNQLHALSGSNIGHYLPNQKIFIDMNGRYMGEIVNGNRLMYRTNSGYSNTSYGSYGNYGNIGNYGNPGNIGSCGTIAGYKDVEI